MYSKKFIALILFLVSCNPLFAEGGEVTQVEFRELSHGKLRIWLPDGPVTPEQKVAYGSLSEDQKRTFLTRRNTMLNGAVKVLHPLLKSRRSKFVSSILALNNFAWERAPLIAASSEFGAELTGGAFATLSAGKKGFYSGQHFGLTFFRNFDSNTFGVEFITKHERLKNTVGVAVQTGIIPTLTGYFASKKGSESVKSISGTAHYPLGPIYTVDSSTLGQVGAHFGVVFPPLVTTSVYTAASLSRIPWLRLEFGKSLPGKIRIDGKLVQPIKQVARAALQTCRFMLSKVSKH